jgi:hypothetical protein
MNLSRWLRFVGLEPVTFMLTMRRHRQHMTKRLRDESPDGIADRSIDARGVSVEPFPYRHDHFTRPRVTNPGSGQEEQSPSATHCHQPRRMSTC